MTSPTNPQTDEIERVARALCIANGDDPDREGERLTGYDEMATAAIAAMDTRLREQIAAKDSLLKQALDAINSARSEPLFIMRDAIRNHLEDCAALTNTPAVEESGD